MKTTSRLTATEMVQNLETANQALRNYVCKLEEQLARYERILQRCPKFRMEQSGAKYSVCDGERIAISNTPIHPLPAGSTVRISHPFPPMADAEGFDGPEEDDRQEKDDWDGLEASDLEDGWEDEEDDWDGLEESDFEDDWDDEEDDWDDEEDDWDGLEESDFEDDWDDEDLDKDDLADADLADADLEADGLKNPPSDGAYSEAVLQAFPHVRTIHRLVARRR